MSRLPSGLQAAIIRFAIRFRGIVMALAVLLILLEIAGGRLRGELVAWIAMAVLAYDPVPWGLAFNAPAWTYRLASAEREPVPPCFRR